MAKINYSDKQIDDYLELAQDVGYVRAMRELGYPASWGTADRWAKLRGIKIEVDELKQRSQAFHDWYQTEDVIMVAQEGMKRVYDELTTTKDLTPDDQKKLSEALNKHYDVWAKVQGKATSITESRDGKTMDDNITELLNMERAKNALQGKASTSVEDAAIAALQDA